MFFLLHSWDVLVLRSGIFIFNTYHEIPKKKTILTQENGYSPWN